MDDRDTTTQSVFGPTGMSGGSGSQDNVVSRTMLQQDRPPRREIRRCVLCVVVRA